MRWRCAVRRCAAPPTGPLHGRVLSARVTPESAPAGRRRSRGRRGARRRRARRRRSEVGHEVRLGRRPGPGGGAAGPSAPARGASPRIVRCETAAYGLLVGVALVMGLLAVTASLQLGEPLRDPDGFLGPSWLRLPLMVAGAFVIDVVPRSLWRARPGLALAAGHALTIVRRALDPRAGDPGGDRADQLLRHLRQLPQPEELPAAARPARPRTRCCTGSTRCSRSATSRRCSCTALLGEGVAAHVLAFVYLFFLPLSPASLVVWLVWSRNISYGYWYATAHCLTWALGTASYYLVPSLGPQLRLRVAVRRPRPDRRQGPAGRALLRPHGHRSTTRSPTRSRASPASPPCTSGSSSPWPWSPSTPCGTPGSGGRCGCSSC